ncbi:MAG TPA: hypothetical protein VMT63_13520 [Bacteroidales bacterium]|nr:hypothetical protein [Bacteroidales bacterium]
MKKTIISILFLSTAFTCFGQDMMQDNINPKWEKIKWLLGAWKGEGTGKPGEGAGTFAFYADLGGDIIIRKNHTEFPAAQNKPASVHDDLMVIYIDQKTGTPAAIYFDNEGHTINYSVSYLENSVVFTSDRSGNIPAFRLTYTPEGKDSVDIAFDMSREDGKFVTYLEGKSVRAR